MRSTNKKFLRSLACMGIAAVIFFGSTSAAYMRSSAAENKDSTIQSMEEQIEKLNAEQDRLMKEINALKSQASQTAAYKQQMDSLITATAQKMELADALVAELDEKIAESKASIEALETTIAETEAKVIERLRYAQENGNVSELELILDSKGLSDFLSRLDKVNSIMEYDGRVMADYKTQVTELNTYKATLEVSKATQTETLKQLEADKAEYQKISDENAAYLSAIANDTAAHEAEYQQMVAAENAINAELTAYIQKMQEQNQVVPSGEGFMRPLPAGVGYISSPFGGRRLNGRNDYHEATDIACAQGTPIYAADSGKVLRAEYHSSYGYYVLIDHGGGLSTLYAHCTTLNVSAGQTVVKGQTIGTVGQTGYAFGYHLHLEVRVNGVRVDPENYIPL